MREGYGRYRHASGMVYSGQWVANKRHGHAIERSHAKVASGTVFREFLVRPSNRRPSCSLDPSTPHPPQAHSLHTLVPSLLPPHPP